MAIYYVRIYGSDSNNGLSPSTAWRTIQKALGNSGISSGDILYIGAGIYRELITVTMVNPTSETFIIGDYDGSNTGDAGEIRITNHLINDETLPSNSNLISLNTRNFLTFKNIIFNCSNGLTAVLSLATSTNIKFIDCNFLISSLFSGASSRRGIDITVGFGINANWLIDRCTFISNAVGYCISILLATGSGEDYNANIKITNSFFISTTNTINITSSGTSSNEGGGIYIYNCFLLGSISTSTLRVGGSLFLYPVEIINCIIYISSGSTAISASEYGNIKENYNLIYCTKPRSNCPIGLQTVTDNSVFLLFSFGNNLKFNQQFSPFTMPLKNSPLLGHGDISINSTNDLLNNPKNIGINNSLFNGTVTSATNLSLTDSSKNFGSSGNLNGYILKIIDGLGKEQSKTINQNTNTTITVDGEWLTTPNITSKYVVYAGQTISTGPISTGSTTTITDNYANWGTNFWQGYTCEITSGFASGENFIISGNNSDTVTGYYPLYKTPVSGDAYLLYWGAIFKGIVSTGTNITLTDNNAKWNISNVITGFSWQNWRCMITKGIASGANFAVSGNSETILSGWNIFSIIPQSGDKYVLYENTGNLSGYYSSGYFPPYGDNFIQCAVGCYQRNNSAIKETGIILSGSNSIKLFGPSIQDFQVPVSGGINNTISVWGYFDDYYSGTKPQLIVKDGSGIGIADNTGIMIGNSGQWEQINLSFTPSSNGIITARLQSNCTGIGGSAYFDAFSIA